ncbi:bis(5'-nucleosyl)-tetraphosphatase (symmetrical) YqeK [Streptococcus sp. DD12]|uniref:bis(5'-nucleosyl)-tetraphosphatase (symmetrical) YqeK n=1 Tax=Streptococcus sp. DD12 TaxID=1777880 RepID=UPI00079841E2|nr:bis(5'-nucleosyl)-tetraphosphatase (symmetrical) YqeK [Streptococcus sp. DD12]KXT76661.1 Hydrolase (HAD superfamily), YqeK [Streptococcus sp. DD12]
MSYADYISCDRDSLIKKMGQQMSQKRLAHCLRVEAAAIDLAIRFGQDPERAGLAGLLHDYAKELPDQEFLTLIDRYGLDPDWKHWGNNVWHGLVGAYRVKEDLDLQDRAIFRAIQFHTVGSADMSDLDMIVYVADYIEDGRDFPGVDKARAIAKLSLAAAVAYETAHTIAFLVQKGQPIFPQTLETYNAYCPYLKEV